MNSASRMIKNLKGRSYLLSAKSLPWIAAAAVQHPIVSTPRAASCNKPGFNTKISQLKIANVRKKNGIDICSVTIIVFMKEAPEIREVTAATSEVGGEYSDMTAMKNKKK